MNRQTPPLTFRRAQAGDREAILAISSRFPNDWLPFAIDHLLEVREGGLYVAETEGHLTAVCSVTINQDQAWLEAMRVAEDEHNRGVATAFTRFLLDLSTEAGCRTARLTTAVDNHPVHRLIGEKLGFRRLGRWIFVDTEDPGAAETLPADSGGTLLRPGDPGDLERVWAFLESRFASGLVVPARLAPPHWTPWSLMDLDRDVVEGHLTGGRVVLGFGDHAGARGEPPLEGLAIWSHEDQVKGPGEGAGDGGTEHPSGPDWFTCVYLEGSPAASAALLGRILELRRERGAQELILSLASTQWDTLRPVLGPDWPSGAFRLDMVVYQKDLR